MSGGDLLTSEVPYIPAMPLDLTLFDDETAALERVLCCIIEGDCYFLSPRIRTLRDCVRRTGSEHGIARPRTRDLRWVRRAAPRFEDPNPLVAQPPV
jgi:hypothetical protein